MVKMSKKVNQISTLEKFATFGNFAQNVIYIVWVAIIVVAQF